MNKLLLLSLLCVTGLTASTDYYIPSGSYDAVSVGSTGGTSCAWLTAGTLNSGAQPYWTQRGCNSGTNLGFVNETFWEFDTSALPDTAIISSSVFWFWVLGKTSTSASNCTMYFDYYTGSMTWKLEADFTGSMATVAYSAWNAYTLNSWQSVNMSNLTSINKTGFTKIQVGMKCTSLAAPTAAAIQMQNYEGGGGNAYGPLLRVTYAVHDSIQVIEIGATRRRNKGQYEDRRRNSNSD